MAFGAALACLALLVPATAAAQECRAPGGNAELDQYCESIPGPGGEQGPDDRGRDRAGIPSGPPPELAGSRDGLALNGFASLSRGVDSATARKAPSGGAEVGPKTDGPYWLIVAALAALLCAWGIARRLRKGATLAPPSEGTNSTPA